MYNMMLSNFKHNIIGSIYFGRDWKNQISAKYTHHERKYYIHKEATVCNAQLCKAIITDTLRGC
jgi:hypothetical protein